MREREDLLCPVPFGRGEAGDVAGVWEQEVPDLIGESVRLPGSLGFSE